MMNVRGITVVALLFSWVLVQGQNFNRNDFINADYELLAGNYEKAQSIFERLLRSDPDNANLNFLNGLCLINIQERKEESLPFLGKAVTNISPDYKYGNPKETQAPLESLKHYGMALQMTDQTSKAIEQLQRYRAELPKKEKQEIQLAEKLLDACFVALELKEKPVTFQAYDLGDEMQSDAPVRHLVVNRDEDMLFYMQEGKYGKSDIFQVEKVNGQWGSPKKISSYLGVNSTCYPTSLSADGSRLYMTVSSGKASDIWVSEIRKGKWQKMKKLDKPINEKGDDSDAFESEDSEYLFFSSERKGGFGGLDIYRSKRTDGGWGKPENLGATVNSTGNEKMSDFNGKTLYFVSDGHKTMGGHDIFISRLEGPGGWSAPENIGFPLNSPDDDFSFAPVGDDIHAYFVQRGTASPFVIQRLEIFSETHPKEFLISGTISAGIGEDVSDVIVDAFHTDDYSLLGTAKPDISSGRYSMSLPAGTYLLSITKPGFKTHSQEIDLTMDAEDPLLSYNILMEKEEPVPVRSDEVTEEKTAVASSEGRQVMADEDFIPVEEVTQPDPVYTSGYSHTAFPGKYTIQFMATLEPVQVDYVLDKYKVEVQRKPDSYYYRYVTGVFDHFTDAVELQRELIAAGYSMAYIRPYGLEEYLQQARIEEGMYTVQFFASKEKASQQALRHADPYTESRGDDGWYRYSSGEFGTLTEAMEERDRLIRLGFGKAYIRRIESIPGYGDQP